MCPSGGESTSAGGPLRSQLIGDLGVWYQFGHEAARVQTIRSPPKNAGRTPAALAGVVPG